MAKIEMNRTVTTNMENLAASLAKRATAETLNTVENFIVHKTESKGGPIRVLLALMKNYGDDISEFPRPGSETGNKPEYFMVNAKRGDAEITRRMSFYTLFYRDTPEGRRNLQTLEHIATFKASIKNKKIDTDDLPEAIKDMGEEELDAYERQVKVRENTAATAYRNAIALGYKLSEVNEVENIEAAIRYEDIEETKPIIGEGSIIVRDKVSKRYRFYSVSAFLLLNPDVAQEKGGGLKNLQESVKRDTNKNTGKGVPKVETLDTWKKIIEAAQAYAGKLEDSTDAEAYGKLLRELGPKAPQGSEDFKLTVYRLYTFLDQIYKNEAIKANAVKLFNEDAVTDKAA